MTHTQTSLLTGLILSAAAPVVVQAADFRVDTDVRFGDNRAPAVQSVTIFKDNTVYDFQTTGDKEVVVFDVTNNRFTVLDPVRKLQTHVQGADLLKFIAQLQAKLAPEDLNERFMVKRNPQKGITVAGQRLTYSAEGQKPQEEAAARMYQHFADWSIRLNALRKGNPPPFARLRLNEEMAKMNLVPTSVTREVKRKTGVSKARSQHNLLWKLTRKDENRIAEAQKMVTTLRTVGPAEYFSELFAKRQ